MVYNGFIFSITFKRTLMQNRINHYELTHHITIIKGEVAPLLIKYINGTLPFSCLIIIKPKIIKRETECFIISNQLLVFKIMLPYKILHNSYNSNNQTIR